MKKSFRDECLRQPRWLTMAPKRRVDSPAKVACRRGAANRLEHSTRAKAKQKIPSKPTKTAWNKQSKLNKTDRQHLYIPRDDVALFLAVLVWFTEPVYAATIWICMVTSRRISETLRLRSSDICLAGGESCDEPHVLFEVKDEDMEFDGMGKLGGSCVVARIAPQAVVTMRALRTHGLDWAILDPLVPFQSTHADVFEEVAVASKSRHNKWVLPLVDSSASGDAAQLLFPALKKSSTPWMSRQAVWMAVHKARSAMHKLTGKRRYNPSVRFNGAHVTVHGATRHTAAALLQFNRGRALKERPSDEAVLEVQQRHDADTYRKHYFHTDSSEVAAALDYAWEPTQFVATGAAAASDTLASGGNVDNDRGSLASPSSARATVLSIEPSAPSFPKGDVMYHSRNAWRKAKRREGLKQWLEGAQASSAQRLDSDVPEL